MKKLLNKQEKFIKYCIFGVLISIIEILLYCILSKFINLEPLIANSIAFILSVLMSYYANSKYVFKTIFISKKSKIKRFYLFWFLIKNKKYVFCWLIYWFINTILIIRIKLSKYNIKNNFLHIYNTYKLLYWKIHIQMKERYHWNIISGIFLNTNK